jgi:hypothetical protein
MYMRQSHWLAAVAFVLAHTIAAPAQIKYGTDYEAGLEKAKKDKKPMLLHFTRSKLPDNLTRAIKSVDNNPQVGEYAAQNFISVKVLSDDMKGQKVFAQFKIDTIPTILVLDQQGRELLHDQISMDPAAVLGYLQKGVDVQRALDALEKVKSNNTAALAAALQSVGELQGVRTRVVLREHAENDKLSDAVRRAALEGLSKQKDAIVDLVPFLGEKSQKLRTMAFNLVKEAGEPAMPALLDGLDGYTPEQRVNCFVLASAVTKNPKISKDANFWRTGSAEDRDAAIKAWKDSYEKTKPNM